MSLYQTMAHAVTGLRAVRWLHLPKDITHEEMLDAVLPKPKPADTQLSNLFLLAGVARHETKAPRNKVWVATYLETECGTVLWVKMPSTVGLHYNPSPSKQLTSLHHQPPCRVPRSFAKLKELEEWAAAAEKLDERIDDIATMMADVCAIHGARQIFEQHYPEMSPYIPESVTRSKKSYKVVAAPRKGLGRLPPLQWGVEKLKEYDAADLFNLATMVPENSEPWMWVGSGTHIHHGLYAPRVPY